MRILLPLLCVSLWAMEAPGTPLKRGKKQSKLASLDDVNVLTYGVLQLSDTMHHTYQDTDRRVTRINTMLQRQQGALQKLRDEVTQATQREGEIRKSLSHLQTQTAGLHTQTLQMKEALRRAETEQLELIKQVADLENSLDTSAPNIRALQDWAHQRSYILKALEEWVQYEQQNLQDQDQQLTRMQSLTGSL